MPSYRHIGGSLGAYIRKSRPTTQQIQALLGDLLPGDELLLPLRDVVARASFRSLYELAGSGKGAIQRDSLLQELAKSYLPQFVDQVGQVLNGMLDLSAGETISANTQVPDSASGIREMRCIASKNRLEKSGGAPCQNQNPHQPPRHPEGTCLSRQNKTERQYPEEGESGRSEQHPGTSTADSARSRSTQPNIKNNKILVSVGILGIAPFVVAAIMQKPHAQQGSVSSQAIKPAYCDQDREKISQMADDLQDYISVSGEVVNPTAEGTWHSALSGLAFRRPPMSYTADQEEFIRVAEAFKLNCE